MRDLPYRVRQFFNAITARVTSEDIDLAQSILPEPLYRLFMELQISDQAHGLRVLRRLLADQYADPDLLQAALLHDLGKSRYPLKLWERIWVVIAGWFFPASRSAWRDLPPKCWKRALLMEARHAEWGAEMVAEAGGGDSLQHLIRYHAENPGQVPEDETGLLHALQTADGLS